MGVWHTLLSTLAVWSILSASPGALAAAGSPGTSAGDKKALRLTTSVVDKRHCHDSQMRLALELNYTNVGGQTLILHKNSNLISRTRVSVNLEAARAGRYQQDVRYSVEVVSLPGRANKQPPIEDFVILRPGESFQTRTEAIIFTAGGKDGLSNKLAAGIYLLQVRVQTWYDSDETAKRLRRSWRRAGSLWTDDVTSEPMPFTFETPRLLVNCP